MRSASAGPRVIVVVALLTALAGCPGPGPKVAPGLDKAQLLDAHREGSDTLRRTMECLQKDSDGNCVANKCTASSAGEIYDCNSFAKACLDAGLHWNGSNAGGVCAVAL
ncbi:MAG: hypothetical protein ABI639_01285 [Thermoanaerobaculia bacterium]